MRQAGGTGFLRLAALLKFLPARANLLVGLLETVRQFAFDLLHALPMALGSPWRAARRSCGQLLLGVLELAETLIVTANLVFEQMGFMCPILLVRRRRAR